MQMKMDTLTSFAAQTGKTRTELNPLTELVPLFCELDPHVQVRYR